MRSYWLIALCGALSPAIVLAQVQAGQVTVSSVDQDEESLRVGQQQTPFDTNQVGRTARSSVGQVGQRQTRDISAIETGIKPTGRINNRIQNRVQSRIRNRIDRNYDPQTRATDTFAAAEDQTRKTGQPR